MTSDTAMGYRSSMMALASKGNGSTIIRSLDPIYGQTGQNTQATSTARPWKGTGP